MYIYIYRITVCLIFHFELYYFLVGFSFSLLEVWVYICSFCKSLLLFTYLLHANSCGDSCLFVLMEYVFKENISEGK